MVGDGTLEARQVPHVGLWTIVLLLHAMLMLLQKNNVQPPSKLGGHVIFLVTYSLVDPLYGFQCLSVKTILGLYIAHYAYGPLFPKVKCKYFLDVSIMMLPHE